METKSKTENMGGTSDFGSDLSGMRDEAQSKLNAALDAARETYYNLQDKAVAGSRATDRAIREHPYQTIGIAFAVGLLIGVLVNRGRSE